MGDFKVKGRTFTVDEQDIKDNMKEFSINREDAVRMYFEDMEIITPKEKDEIVELNATKQKRRYEKSGNPRKPVERVRKVDNDKKAIIEKVVENFGDMVTNISVKNEVEISFSYNDADYTFKLIKHRKPKGE